MKYLVYRCVDCDHEEVSRYIEGKSCRKCAGPSHAKREADADEIKNYHFERWKPRGIGDIKVTLTLQPWFNVLQEEIVKAFKAAADAGMPEQLAYEIACYSVERAVKHAVALK